MILVTGASGNVGSALVQCLSRCRLPFRTATSSPESLGARVEFASVKLDFTDPATYGPALHGCKAVFLMRPPAISDTKNTLNVFIQAARDSGVTHIVFLSAAGADKLRWVPHHAVEVFLRAGPPDWTILRPSFFSQNLGGAYRRDIQNDNRIYLPAGAGKASFIDVRDIAEVAAIALANPKSHHGKAYHLTGPYALGFDEVAVMLSTVLRRKILYQRASLAGYAWHLGKQGLPALQVLVQTVLHLGLRFGQGQTCTNQLAQLLGRPATPLLTYAQDHAALWSPTPARGRA